MQYTLYNEETGLIIRRGSSATEESCLAKVQPGERMALGVYLDDTKWRFVDGEPVEYVQEKTPQETQAEILAGTQRRLDDFAQTRNYDGILSACTYATDPDPVFSTEGQCAVSLRSETWRVLYQMLSEVQAGIRPMPANYEDIEPELPALEWT